MIIGCCRVWSWAVLWFIIFAAQHAGASVRPTKAARLPYVAECCSQPMRILQMKHQIFECKYPRRRPGWFDHDRFSRKFVGRKSQVGVSVLARTTHHHHHSYHRISNSRAATTLTFCSTLFEAGERRGWRRQGVRGRGHARRDSPRGAAQHLHPGLEDLRPRQVQKRAGGSHRGKKKRLARCFTSPRSF